MRPTPLRALLPILGLALVAADARADKFFFSGEHGIRFSNAIGGEIVATGTGVAVVNGGSGPGPLQTLELTAPFATISTTVLPTASGPISSVRLQGVRIDPTVQGGIFAPILGALTMTANLTRSTAPHAGVVRLCQDIMCGTMSALTQTLGITVGGGVGGTGVGTSPSGPGPVTIGGAGPTRVTLVGAPWTIHTTTVSFRTPSDAIDTLTGMGYAHGAMSGTGSTATPSGTVQLVTGTQVTTVGGNVDLSGHITRLTLHFTPEPHLLLALVAGAFAMALLGRERLRR